MKVIKDPHEVAMDEIKLGFGVALVIVVTAIVITAVKIFN